VDPCTRDISRLPLKPMPASLNSNPEANEMVPTYRTSSNPAEQNQDQRDKDYKTEAAGRAGRDASSAKAASPTLLAARLFASLALLPFVVLQGRATRRRVPRLPSAKPPMLAPPVPLCPRQSVSKRPPLGWQRTHPAPMIGTRPDNRR
jgi:hypothetical protein